MDVSNVNRTLSNSVSGVHASWPVMTIVRRAKKFERVLLARITRRGEVLRNFNLIDRTMAELAHAGCIKKSYIKSFS